MSDDFKRTATGLDKINNGPDWKRSHPCACCTKRLGKQRENRMTRRILRQAGRLNLPQQSE